MKDIIHISYTKIDFKCPYCEKQYKDENDFYYKRINKNKWYFTTQVCSCGEKFGITYNMMGHITSFKLESVRLKS